MPASTFTIARFTFYEAVRNRLFILTIIGMICMFGLSEFVGELAITETKDLQSVFIAAGLRIFSIVTVALFVITSVVREFNDKGFEMILSLPIRRSSYYFGKFLGFSILAIILVFAASLLLMIYSQPGYIFLWGFSLFCELLIVISLSLLCLFTFSNITISFIAVIAFYLLSRSMYVIKLISTSPILEFKTFSQEFMNFLVDAISFILPELNNFTQSEWLIYGTNSGDITLIIAQTMIYLPILWSAGLFDLYRKDL